VSLPRLGHDAPTRLACWSCSTSNQPPNHAGEKGSRLPLQAPNTTVCGLSRPRQPGSSLTSHVPPSESRRRGSPATCASRQLHCCAGSPLRHRRSFARGRAGGEDHVRGAQIGRGEERRARVRARRRQQEDGPAALRGPVPGQDDSPPGANGYPRRRGRAAHRRLGKQLPRHLGPARVRGTVQGADAAHQRKGHRGQARRRHLPARDQVQEEAQRGVWAHGMGYDPQGRTRRGQHHRDAGIRPDCGWPLRLPGTRRKPLLQPRPAPLGRRGLQVQRAHALLQGPGHRLRAVGSALCPLVQEDADGGGLGRARHDEEEAHLLVPQGRGGRGVPVQAGAISGTTDA
ncbi:hypothetical protein TCAP_03672, partial [Tolypocladium capitatum]